MIIILIFIFAYESQYYRQLILCEKERTVVTFRTVGSQNGPHSAVKAVTASKPAINWAKFHWAVPSSSSWFASRIAAAATCKFWTCRMVSQEVVLYQKQTWSYTIKIPFKKSRNIYNFSLSFSLYNSIDKKRNVNHEAPMHLRSRCPCKHQPRVISGLVLLHEQGQCLKLSKGGQLVFG